MHDRNYFIMSKNKSYFFLRNLYKSLWLNHYGNISLNKEKPLLLILLFFNIFFSGFTHVSTAQIEEYIAPQLKTVQLNRVGWEFSYPLLILNTQQQLQLTFDEPGSDVNNYYYTITLCDADWNIAPVMVTEYIVGITENPILNYEYSFNTTFDYVHYQLKFPNKDIKLTKSGNYILTVYEDNNKESPVLIKHFMVVEPLVTIIPQLTYAAQSSLRDAFQEIDFKVSHQGFSIQDPMQEIKATIIQNGRTDNKITNLRPLFILNNLLDFNYNRVALMEGGNEFRYVDLRSTRFLSERIKEINFIDPFYHYTLFPDFPRNKESYRYYSEINGRFKVEVSEYDNDNLQADYAFVHFQLKTDFPQPSQKVYINGALTNWQLNETSEMMYNAQNNAYEKTLLLKQGYYNYQYLVRETGDEVGQVCPMENCFQQTENDYLILIYYKPSGARSDRIIGAHTINTLRGRAQ